MAEFGESRPSLGIDRVADSCEYSFGARSECIPGGVGETVVRWELNSKCFVLEIRE